MKALVHIIYITSTSHGQSLDSLNVSVEISPKMEPNNDTIYFPLKDLDISTNKSMWYFNVQQVESQCVSICIFETASGTPSPISKLSIPLSQFSINQTIRCEFKMTPTAPGGQSFTALIEICLNNNIMTTSSNESNNTNFRKNLINRTILQPKKPSPAVAQPRNMTENHSPRSRPFSLPISAFNTFQNDCSSFSTQSDTNDQNSYNSSSSSIDSVQLDLSESSDDQIQERKEGEDDSSSSYLSESSKSEDSKSKKQSQEGEATFSEPDGSKSGDKSIENSEEKQENKKKHKHHHRHHHHHHRHHQHQHEDRVHYHRRSHHHHHHHHHHSSSETSKQPNEQQRASRPRRLLHKQQLDEANIGSQRILKPHIRSIASDKNIHKKRAFIAERQSALNLALYNPRQTTESSNIATEHPRLLKRNANNHTENPFLM